MRVATFLVALSISTIAISCSSGSKAKTQPLVPTAAVSQTPTTDARMSEAIDLAVRLGVMTQTQATCVFHDHPSILQVFIEDEEIGTTAIITDDVAKQKAEDLIRNDAVQLDRCFSVVGS